MWPPRSRWRASAADRVVLVGASMGAVAAARYATTDPDLAGVVLVSCPSRWKLPRNVRGVLAAGMTRTRPGRLLVSRLSGVRLAPKWTNAMPPVGLVAELELPVALVHGRQDRFIVCGDAAQLYAAAPEPRRLTMVPRMGHAFGPDAIRARARRDRMGPGDRRARRPLILPPIASNCWKGCAPNRWHHASSSWNSATDGLQFAGRIATLCNHGVAGTADLPRPEPGGRFEDDLGRKMLDQRRVMLTGAIDGPLAERVCAQLLVLEAERRRPPDHALPALPRRRGRRRLRDLRHDAGAALRRRDRVHRASRRRWRSSCSAAGRPGQRSAYAHSRILMHQPLGSVQGYAVDIAIQAEQFTIMRRADGRAHRASTPGQTVERILADGDRDRWFTPEEALDYGMIDEILQLNPLTVPRRLRR